MSDGVMSKRERARIGAAKNRAAHHITREKHDRHMDVWTTMNRVQENLIRGGVSDWHRDRRGKLRSVRALRGIDSKVGLNKGLWGLAERITNGETLPEPESIALAA